VRPVRGYIFSRSFAGERVPQHVQNLVIRDYCKQQNLHYLLSATEYAMPGCHLILDQVLDELPRLHGIVTYSLFQLPEDRKTRRRIFDTVLSLGKTLYFAVEGLGIQSDQDVQRVDSIDRIRRVVDQDAEKHILPIQFAPE